jgi:predicted dehydrogenase
MTHWRQIDYGDTDYETAVVRGDLYGIRAAARRAAKQLLRVGVVDPDAAALEKVAALYRAPRHVAIKSLPARVEKPLSATAQEACELCLFAEVNNVRLASVANKRLSPPYGFARVLVVDGATPRFVLGAIKTIATSAAAMSFKPWERVEIIGRNAMLILEDQFEPTLCDEQTAPPKSCHPVAPNTLTFESFGDNSGLVDIVLDSIRGLALLNGRGRDGAAVLALVEAIHDSIRWESIVDCDRPAATRRGEPKS